MKDEGDERVNEEREEWKTGKIGMRRWEREQKKGEGGQTEAEEESTRERDKRQEEERERKKVGRSQRSHFRNLLMK